MRIGHFKSPVSTSSHAIKKFLCKTLPQWRKRRLFVRITHRRFVEVSQYDPSFRLRFWKACLNNFPDRACFSLPDKVCLFGFWVWSFEVAHKERETLEIHLKTIATKQRTISKVIRQRIKSEVRSSEMRVTFDFQGLGFGQHCHVEAPPVVSGQTSATWVIWRPSWNKEVVTKELQRLVVEDLLQRNNIGLCAGNDFGGQFPICDILLNRAWAVIKVMICGAIQHELPLPVAQP